MTTSERRRELARIHIAATSLQLDRETYVALLRRVSAALGSEVNSAAGLDELGRHALLRELVRLGFKADKHGDRRHVYGGRPKGHRRQPDVAQDRDSTRRREAAMELRARPGKSHASRRQARMAQPRPTAQPHCGVAIGRYTVRSARMTPMRSTPQERRRKADMNNTTEARRGAESAVPPNSEKWNRTPCAHLPWAAAHVRRSDNGAHRECPSL